MNDVERKRAFRREVATGRVDAHVFRQLDIGAVATASSAAHSTVTVEHGAPTVTTSQWTVGDFAAVAALPRSASASVGVVREIVMTADISATVQSTIEAELSLALNVLKDIEKIDLTPDHP